MDFTTVGVALIAVGVAATLAGIALGRREAYSSHTFDAGVAAGIFLTGFILIMVGAIEVVVSALAGAIR